MTLSPPTLIKLLTPVAVFAVVLAVLVALNRGGAPFPPAIADPGAPTGDAVKDFQRAVRAAPGSAAAYAGLGDAYLARARETADPGFYTRAERAFDAALRRDPDHLGALIGAGTLAGLRHEFRAQLTLGRRAAALAPQLARPYTVIADAQIELGRHRQAARSIQRLVDGKPGLAAYARASYYRELSGDLPGAVAAMRLAASAGGTPENVAYVQALVGDLELQRGRVGAARLAYAAALRSVPGYPAGLVGLARADAAGGEPGRAAARLRRAAARLPLTSTLALLAQVEREVGRPAAAAAALDAARAQQRLYRAAATAPDAEAVVFEAEFGSPAAAVRLGRRVWRAAPSVRSADALGWALTRAGRPFTGYRLAQRALRLGSRDPAFRLHAGIAAREAGLAGPASRHLAIAAAGRAALGPRAAALLRAARRTHGEARP
jgi:tetratricopeptide (TPR) repeat protein